MMPKKLIAKIFLPNKTKQNSKRRNRRPKISGAGRAMVGGGIAAGASLTRISESFMPLFPAKVKKTLRYQEYVTLTSTGGTLNSYVFSANGLYDPNITGTGHSPMGFDQMMIFFEHYVVEFARITVNFNNTATGCMMAGIRMDPNFTGLSNIQQMLEFGGITFDNFEAKNTYGCTKTMKMGCSIGKIQGVSRSALTADVNLRGDVASNPSEQTYFHLVAWDPNSLTGSFTCDVIIEYDAIFTEPRVATQSLVRREEGKRPVRPAQTFR